MSMVHWWLLPAYTLGVIGWIIILCLQPATAALFFGAGFFFLVGDRFIEVSNPEYYK